MMSIVDRLRAVADEGYKFAGEAADEITRLRIALGWLVIRRTDGTIILNQDPMALEMAVKLMRANE